MLVRRLIRDDYKVEAIICEQEDNVVRTGVVTIEEEVKMLEKAGYNFKSWLEKNYESGRLKELSEEREEQLNDLDFKEDLDKIDMSRQIEKSLEENEKEANKINEENIELKKQIEKSNLTDNAKTDNKTE